MKTAPSALVRSCMLRPTSNIGFTPLAKTCLCWFSLPRQNIQTFNVEPQAPSFGREEAMTKFAYFNGAIRPIEEAQVSIMNLTFNYGIGCFGGLRGYWDPVREEIHVFRIQDHYRRFLNSA